MFIPHFGVSCDQLLNKPTQHGVFFVKSRCGATWNVNDDICASVLQLNLKNQSNCEKNFDVLYKTI